MSSTAPADSPPSRAAVRALPRSVQLGPCRPCSWTNTTSLMQGPTRHESSACGSTSLPSLPTLYRRESESEATDSDRPVHTDRPDHHSGSGSDIDSACEDNELERRTRHSTCRRRRPHPPSLTSNPIKGFTALPSHQEVCPWPPQASPLVTVLV